MKNTMKSTKLLRDLKLAGLLTENKILTKEQEIKLLKTRLKELASLNEIEFANQAQFDKYHKAHKLRPTTKVKIAGKTTTAGQAAAKGGAEKAKGTSVFGGKPTQQSTAIKNVDSLSSNATMKAIQKATGGKFEMGFDTNDKGKEYAQLIDPKTNLAFYELHDMPGGGVKVLDVYAGKYIGKAKDTKDLMQMLPKLNRASYEKDFPND